MLTSEENELLVRTGPGTPMGRLMRRYWIPVSFSAALPRADAPPVRVKILGESLVLFRDSSGRAGLVDERCPHRGASLFFGRNEDNGLRCVYHGWKFDLEGRCTDMPSEPADSTFRNKVSVAAYPCEERGGIVWAYMGPPELKPGLPQLEWMGVPETHRFVTRHLQECNWFQALEGGFDTSHLTFLHRGDTGGGSSALPSRYEVVPTDFGFVTATGRQSDPLTTRWSVSAMLLPFHKVISRFVKDGPIGAHAWVPVDDEHCMNWSIEYHPDRPLGEAEMERSRNGYYIHAENLPGSDRTVLNRDNEYLIDRELQRRGDSYTGIKGIGMQDCGIQESMGPISDRTREHLGVSDTAIIKLRRLLLRTLKDMEEGKAPPASDPASYRVRSAGFALPAGSSLEEAVTRHTRIHASVD
jgi:phthalate 4,5-dioxygenase oxygenase subunit